MATQKCLKCGSENTITGKIGTTGGFHFRPDDTKTMSLSTGDVAVSSSLCLDCGLIELMGDIEKAKRLTGKK